MEQLRTRPKRKPVRATLTRVITQLQGLQNLNATPNEATRRACCSTLERWTGFDTFAFGHLTTIRITLSIAITEKEGSE